MEIPDLTHIRSLIILLKEGHINLICPHQLENVHHAPALLTLSAPKLTIILRK